jgi:hypothetical protein
MTSAPFAWAVGAQGFKRLPAVARVDFQKLNQHPSQRMALVFGSRFDLLPEVTVNVAKVIVTHTHSAAGYPVDQVMTGWSSGDRA